MQRKGTIYTEIHNHGRRSGGSQDGNRSSMRRVRGVGMQRCYGYRWVAEITYHGKRYRCRSYDYSRVRAWLDQMCDRFNDEANETSLERRKRQPTSQALPKA